MLIIVKLSTALMEWKFDDSSAANANTRWHVSKFIIKLIIVRLYIVVSVLLSLISFSFFEMINSC